MYIETKGGMSKSPKWGKPCFRGCTHDFVGKSLDSTGEFTT